MNSLSEHELVGDVRPSIIRYGVLLLLCLAATVSYVSRNSLSLVESQVSKELELTPDAMGLAMSTFFFVYAILQVPTGWLTQRFGSRTTLTAFALIWSSATAITGLVSGLPALIATRAINGAAQAGLFAGCTTSISHWFPRTRHAFANGTLSSFMSAGGAIGAAVTGLLALSIGWRSTMLVYGCVGWLWGIVFFIWFRNLPAEHWAVNSAEQQLIEQGTTGADREQKQSQHSRGHVPWLLLLASPALWWICLQQFFRACGYIFFSSWFPTYLQKTRDVSLADAGYLTSMPLLAVVIGGILGGAFSDRILVVTGSRRLARQGVSIFALVICSALIFSAYFVHHPVAAVALISLGTFFFAVGGPNAYTITIDMGGPYVATVFSIMNMCGNLGASLFPLIVPQIVKISGSWEPVLLLFSGLFLAAACSWALLKPDGTIMAQSLLRTEAPDRRNFSD